MTDNIPKRITEDQYDKLMRKLWEMEQRLVGIEKQVRFDTTLDEIYARMQLIERMLKKIGVALLGRRKKTVAPPHDGTVP